MQDSNLNAKTREVFYCEDLDDKIKLGWNQVVFIKWLEEALIVLNDDKTLKYIIVAIYNLWFRK